MDYSKDNQTAADLSEQAGETSPLEALRDDSALLGHDSDNLSFYLASRAYHDDRNYEEAVEKYAAAIEYETALHPQLKQAKIDLERQAPKIAKAGDVVAKSMYWLAESYLKIKQTDKTIEMFEALIDGARHYLQVAAERRLKVLKAKYGREGSKPK